MRRLNVCLGTPSTRAAPVKLALAATCANGGGTVARIRATGEARGFFRVAAPLLNPMVRRSIAADLNS